MTCKNDCLHYNVCQYHIDEETPFAVTECNNFKNKADFVEAVLCRECVKHGKRECIVNRKMSLYDHVTTTKADAFCSEGKRRE